MEGIWVETVLLIYDALPHTIESNESLHYLIWECPVSLSVEPVTSLVPNLCVTEPASP